MRKWNDLPEYMQIDEVKPYYELVSHRKFSLLLKRIFDIVMSLVLIVLLLIPMLVISLLIVCDSRGGVFYRQERVTRYGKHFKIFKFRTMVSNADKIGAHVTANNDSRITKIGAKLRGARLDELPQVFNVLTGDMSFVGTRPEAVRYVEKYSGAMWATLLMPAGITSEASILYKDEAELLENADDADIVYVDQVLPTKMEYNLKSLREFSFVGDIKTMLRTVIAVIK
ncbi:sugar transferase [Pseudobutyrivibrio ruminis]|uniref:Glycosyl transferase n=1 Tax=Pseudobutyrivibrio ruminis TaxID=46206 RepID=A0A2G3DU87_9FIRM|nr:sugar transferase [Pseudobutyrivibrio ruminis]PHU34453.1 glycosyl transferase [Pseudobutyrivibrio ruminis]